jgi:hypothetical protein
MINKSRLVTWKRALMSKQVMIDRRVQGTSFRKKL